MDGRSAAWAPPEPGEPRLSPDEKTIVYRKTVDGDSNIWLMDLAASATRRLTFTTAETDPAWSPDALRVSHTASSQIVERPSPAPAPSASSSRGGRARSSG